MKFRKLFVIVLILSLVGGCDFLGHDENTIFTKHDVFHNASRAKFFLNSLYAYIPYTFKQMGNSMRASATDDAVEANEHSAVHHINDGTWSPTQTVDATNWTSLYRAIRAANQFLKNYDFNNFSSRRFNNIYPQTKRQFKSFPYEARFLRAFFYFKLIKRYGHVPLVTKVLTPDEADTLTPSSYQTVTHFIVSQCDSVIPHLPVSYENIPIKQTGRATQGAAMALKARALLYAASPLHNPSGDVKKWIKAAKAAKAIIDLKEYSLDPNYTDIFNNYTNNPELIWGRRAGFTNYFERFNFPIGFEGTSTFGTDPSQNLVNAYHMQKNGLPISNPNSGYNPQKPYQGRDPRLKETIIVNNSLWKGRNVQIWKNGKDGPPQKGATRTGYYLKKYVVEGVSLAPTHTTTAEHTRVIFRYGGILLDYAEAMNEAFGPTGTDVNPNEGLNLDMTALQAVDKIRERSHMPDFPMGLSKAAFRKKIHNECRVEMAFENQRFWDMRRWKLPSKPNSSFTTIIKGMAITKNADGSFTYKVKTVAHRIWKEKMYFYPIPESEILKNPGLKQNKDWRE